MDPSELYERRAIALLAEAETLNDPRKREVLRELAACWLRQAEHAAEYWSEERQRAA
jgi:hypothetical protein